MDTDTHAHQCARLVARFDLQLYLHNREWRSVLGSAALWAVLYGKMVWAG